MHEPREHPWPCRRARCVAGVAAFLVAAWSGGALAQFPPPLAQPDLVLAEAGTTQAIARLADGRLVVAGNFNRVDGAPRAYLVRLMPDGTVDTTWNPAPNGIVSAIHVDALGRVYIGGTFTRIGDITRTRLARFDATGALDPSWTPTANGSTNAIVAGEAGEVCLGGAFTAINGVARNRIACVSTADGALDAGFAPDVGGTVHALAVSGTALYAGGSFTTVGGIARANAARFTLSGTGTPDAWNPAPNGSTFALHAAPAGIYLGGSFGGVGATARRGIARVNASTGAVDAAFNPGGGATFALILSIVDDGSGGVFAAGSFSEFGGGARHNAVRLSASGAVVAGWNPDVRSGYASEALREPNGDVVIAGPFSQAGGGEHLGITRVLGNGTIDPQLNTAIESPGSAFAVARVPGDGALVVGGAFARANGLIRRNLVKVRADGTIDPNWTPSTDADVRQVVVDTLGRTYIAGDFDAVGTVARNGLARLLNSADGALDPNWVPTANNAPFRLLLRPEGLYVNTSVGGATNLARLSTGLAATVDAGWTPNPNGGVTDMAVTGDGALIVAGTFTTIGGAPRAGLARVGTGASATIDPLWTPQVTGDASTVRVAHHDNAIYLSGEFTAVNGTPRTRLAKIGAVGGGALDLAWSPSLTASDGYALTLVADDDHLYVAGNAGGGFFRPFLARYDHVLGWRDPTWRPAPDGGIFGALPDGDRVCIAGFSLTRLGGASRQGFGCLPKAGVDALLTDGFEGDE